MSLVYSTVSTVASIETGGFFLKNFQLDQNLLATTLVASVAFFMAYRRAINASDGRGEMEQTRKELQVLLAQKKS